MATARQSTGGGKGRDQRTGSPEVDQALAEQRSDQQYLLNNPTLRGTRMQRFPIEPGENIIFHKLGRAPQGWWVTRAIGAAPALYETAADKDRLVLTSDVAATVDLWVFV